MAVGFWQLLDNLRVSMYAPAEVLALLATRLYIDDGSTSQLLQTTTIKLTWEAEAYRQYYSNYWQRHFGEEDVVWKETENGWLYLGYGFFLAYNKVTRMSQFFAVAERLEAVFIYSYPLLKLLVALLREQRYAPLHAAVIGAENRFVLIPGKQNTGKSTTTASWVLNGGQMVTDDFCFVQADNPTIVHGFYPSIRLREQALPLINPYLTPGILQQKDDSKYFLSVLTHLPDSFVPKAGLSAIFCLTIHNKNLSHKSLSAKTGFEYLASSVAFSAKYDADVNACLMSVKKLVRQLPILQVNLSPNLTENYAYLKELVAAY